MDLKDKVINFGLAEQLKDLGIDHNKSLFSWIKHDYQKKYHVGFTRITYEGLIQDRNGLQQYPAFTSDELMDLLPSFIDTKKGEPYNNFGLEVYKRTVKNIQYIVKYVCDTHGVDRYGSLAKVTFTNRNIYDENLANALAKMLILLIEENLYIKREPIDTSEIL